MRAVIVLILETERGGAQSWGVTVSVFRGAVSLSIKRDLPFVRSPMPSPLVFPSFDFKLTLFLFCFYCVFALLTMARRTRNTR
jgi:hypothetical protein